MEKPPASFLRWLRDGAEARWGRDPDHFDPVTVGATIDALSGPVFGPRGWFRVEVQGVERVPPAPVMVVSNHSGGTVIPDAWGFLWLWYRHFGTARPLHASGHELIFANDRLGRWFSRRGVLHASPALGHRVLAERKRDLLVMPGGDRDTWRPYSRRYQVEFAGRTGYARLALQARVPIVPVANAGAHETLVVLTDGHRLARAVGLHAVARAEIFPVHLSLPWGLAVGPWPHIPIPTTLRYRLGAPIAVPDELADGAEVTDAMVLAHDARVRAAVQGLLDELRDTR
jgi:1-acyl-sn-glycerol-3-phosphate acyltransferase